MYAVMGVTGQVGRGVAEQLLADGKGVRVVARNKEKALGWQQRGCEIALADIGDRESLMAAFQGAEGVFAMLPPSFDPSPGYPETAEYIESLQWSLREAAPNKAVVLSTVGGQVGRPNLLEQLHEMENRLCSLTIPVAFLRAAWSMENAAWDVTAARQGQMQSFLQPVDRAIPMVATRDIGASAAQLLQESWDGVRVVQIEGPRRYSPQDVAQTFASLLGKPVATNPVPRSTWRELFLAQGMRNPEPRMQMLDGFNEGWLDFEPGLPIVHGSTPLHEVLGGLLAKI